MTSWEDRLARWKAEVGCSPSSTTCPGCRWRSPRPRPAPPARPCAPGTGAASPVAAGRRAERTRAPRPPGRRGRAGRPLTPHPAPRRAGHQPRGPGGAAVPPARPARAPLRRVGGAGGTEGGGRARGPFAVRLSVLVGERAPPRGKTLTRTLTFLGRERPGPDDRGTMRWVGSGRGQRGCRRADGDGVGARGLRDARLVDMAPRAAAQRGQPGQPDRPPLRWLVRRSGPPACTAGSATRSSCCARPSPCAAVGGAGTNRRSTRSAAEIERHAVALDCDLRVVAPPAGTGADDQWATLSGHIEQLERSAHRLAAQARAGSPTPWSRWTPPSAGSASTWTPRRGVGRPGPHRARRRSGRDGLMARPLIW